jgi:hypothetical protein
MEKTPSVLQTSVTMEDNITLALRLQAAADKASVDRVNDYTMHEAERKAAAALFRLVEAQAAAQLVKLEKELAND